MKKLFVSVPMKGRTEEEIKASIQKMKKKQQKDMVLRHMRFRHDM